MTQKKFSRREFLQVAAVTATGALAAACAPKVVEVPVKETVEVPVEQTVEVPIERTVEVTAAPQETVTVTFWYPRSHPDPAAEEDYWLLMARTFESSNPGIKVDWIPQSWSDIFKKIAASVESGDTPDITMTGFKTVLQYAAEGAVMPLDDVVENLGGADALKPLDQFFVWDGKWWGLPNTEGSNVFYYRKDLLEEAGFDGKPQDWDELLEAAKALTTGDRYGLDAYYSMANWTSHYVVSFINAADGGILGQDGELMLTHPNTVEAITYYTDLMKKHKVVPPSRVVDTDWGASTMPAYGAGKVAMFAYSGSTYGKIKDQFPDIYEKTGAGTFPNGPSGHTGHVAYVNPMWAFAESKHPDETKKFLEFLQSKDAVVTRARVYNALLGGQRGYTWIEEELPQLLESPVTQAVKEATPYAVDGFFPLAHPVGGKADGELYIPTMIQDIVVNDTPVEEALAKAEKYVEGLLAEFEARHA